MFSNKWLRVLRNKTISQWFLQRALSGANILEPISKYSANFKLRNIILRTEGKQD